MIKPSLSDILTAVAEREPVMGLIQKRDRAVRQQERKKTIDAVVKDLRRVAGRDGHFGFRPAFPIVADYIEEKYGHD